MNKIKVFSVIWSSWLPVLRAAAHELAIELVAYTNKDLAHFSSLRATWEEELSQASFAFLYRTNDAGWDELEELVRSYRDRLPIVIVNSNQPPMEDASSLTSLAYRYLLFGGQRNLLNLLKFLIHNYADSSVLYDPPMELPWQGLFHPDHPEMFSETEDYLAWYLQNVNFEPLGVIGLLYSRSDWVNDNLTVVRAVVRALEGALLGVMPVFFYPLKDRNLGNLSGPEVIERFFMKGGQALVDGIVKLTSFPLSAAHGDIGRVTDEGVSLLTRMNIPLFCPIICYSRTGLEWWVSDDGLGSQVAWSLAMPEFEGAIEPLLVGAMDAEGTQYAPIEERVKRFAQRVSRWLALRKKPNREKKVVFVLHNNPCASAEATVGSGAHLDTMESVVAAMKKMAEAGYVVNPPADGQALKNEILGRKAVSEFRWTTVEDIVGGGGALALIDREQYEKWWREIPDEARERMISTWGEPPGEAMVYEGKIVVPGVRFGNVVVLVQPKRGCAGPRCDGRTCKILHDPQCPPPHQYLATYRWLERDFLADVIIHVGTHGNLEFLPGKGTGLSAKCFPDLAIDGLPHLYIYNADNPPEGVMAKRRSYACLIDHMQTVMVGGSLYGDGEKLYQLISEYQERRQEKTKSLIASLAGKVGFLSLPPDTDLTEEQIGAIKDELELIRGTALPEGMHVLGTRPEGERLVDFIWSILRYQDLTTHLKKYWPKEETKQEIEQHLRAILSSYLLDGRSLKELLPAGGEVAFWEAKIDNLRARILASDEIGSLLNGMNAGYVPPGPAGLITRGDDGVLPTGRNFYSFNPRLIPSPAAWEVGKVLAVKAVERYRQETGRWPENIAFYWQCTDIMWTRGEGMCQMMHLLGVEPVWDGEGRVSGIEIIPLAELGRPRIDITVRVSGITRDHFPSAISLLDEAVRRVALLEEPVELNFVRKHSLEKLAHVASPKEEDWRRSTFRIFASMPGTYQAGTQLAIYASAWQTEKELARVFLYWNGYAYGNGVVGKEAHQELASSLQTVDMSFNRAITDEYDLTGCCSMFGAHGGMINAARVISGRDDLKHYYGDTRDPDGVKIRTLQEEIRRIARGKILNPRWIEGMKRHGYQGGGEIMKRVGRLYGWQATTQMVDDAIFDDIVRVFIMDEGNRKYLAEHNPWAMEEMARRLLEAAKRNLWKPSAEVKDALQELYLEIEGYVEETIDGRGGERQGGEVQIIAHDEVAGWVHSMKEVIK